MANRGLEGSARQGTDGQSLRLTWHALCARWARRSTSTRTVATESTRASKCAKPGAERSPLSAPTTRKQYSASVPRGCSVEFRNRYRGIALWRPQPRTASDARLELVAGSLDSGPSRSTHVPIPDRAACSSRASLRVAPRRGQELAQCLSQYLLNWQAHETIGGHA